jgi:hypothetical protein
MPLFIIPFSNASMPLAFGIPVAAGLAACAGLSVCASRSEQRWQQSNMAWTTTGESYGSLMVAG